MQFQRAGINVAITCFAMDAGDAKLVLIMPPQRGLLNGFAAGLVSLANYVSVRLPEVGIEILDFSNFSLSEAEATLHDVASDWCARTTFVGITTTTASYQSALKLAAIVKSAAQRAVIVLGGHHASADAEVVLQMHSHIVDLVVVGEGERPLCETIQNYPNVANISGVAFLKDGIVKQTPPSTPLSPLELDAIPALFNGKGLLGTAGKFNRVTYVSARGCPMKCGFCAVGKEPIRAKSVAAISRDIEQLLAVGSPRLAIEDNFFAHSPQRTREVCVVLASVKDRYPKFTWDCQTRVESLARPETIPLLAEAGCEAVYIGVESVLPDQLIYLKKTATPERYLRQLIDVVIPRLLDTNIHCYINLQFGLPGETVSDGEQTARVIAMLGRTALAKGRDITIFPQLHVVYPGTEHFRQGLLQTRFPRDVFESFTEWEERQAQIFYWLGEHFAHGAGGVPEGIMCSALLKNGKYSVDGQAVLRISGTLRKLHRLPGVRVFDYGEHIVTNEACAGQP